MDFKFKVTKAGDRLDRYLSNNIEDYSRSFLQKLIKDGNVLVNNMIQKPRYILSEGDIIIVEIPKEERLKLIPQKIDLDIVYEDDDIAVIDKPLDLVVHPGDKNLDGTLANALLYHFDQLSDIGDDLRPGIVHRLDKNTSGLLVIAKNNFSHEFLVNKFKSRDVNRIYISIVRGVLEQESGTINEPIGRDKKNRTKMVVNYKNGKEAITHYRVLERFNKFTLVEARLETGRTHQIRAHFNYINHPILGDEVYFKGKMPFNIKHQLLHCIKIGFVHPKTEKYMDFETEIPPRFKNTIEKIKKGR